MDTHVHPEPEQTAGTQHLHREIERILRKLAPDELRMIREFAEFVYIQAKSGRQLRMNVSQQAAQRYPTQFIPASVLSSLTALLPPMEGDALLDTEAIYDGV